MAQPRPHSRWRRERTTLRRWRGPPQWLRADVRLRGGGGGGADARALLDDWHTKQCSRL
jgi:hypothetical protein